MDSSCPSRHRNVPDWKCYPSANKQVESEMKLTRIGLDLAKNVFESPLPEGRGFLDTVLGSLRLSVTLCLA